MSDRKQYSVIELAERIGVPRTTINDWLGKYSPYIEFTMQGRRRVYSEGTLTVLQKVSELRTAGLSSYDIEKQLAAAFPVHPEPEQPEKSEEKLERESLAEPGAEQGAPVSASPDLSASTALIAKESSDAMMRAVGERFQTMLDKMSKLEEDSHRNALRAWFFTAFALILLILLAAGGWFAWRYSLEMKKSSDSKDQSLRTLAEKTAVLNTYSVSLQDDVRKLQDGMSEQRKAFDTAMSEARLNFEKRKEAELALAKEKFASEKLQYLRDMDQLNRDREKEHEAELRGRDQKLRQQESELAAARKRLADTLSSAAKPALSASSEAPVKEGNPAVKPKADPVSAAEPAKGK